MVAITDTDTNTAAALPVGRIAYSPRELAEALGCTRQHIHNMLTRGELASFKLGRKRLIRADAVEALIGADADAAAS